MPRAFGLGCLGTVALVALLFNLSRLVAKMGKRALYNLVWAVTCAVFLAFVFTAVALPFLGG